MQPPGWKNRSSRKEPISPDHSYRGFGADGATGELLLLNVNAKTAKYFLSHRDRDGKWNARGTIGFPIRGAYPQVALRNGAAHVLAHRRYR